MTCWIPGCRWRKAVRLVRAAGAAKVRTAVFARKPWAGARRLEPDFVAWEAPARFLGGVRNGRGRPLSLGLAEVAAVD